LCPRVKQSTGHTHTGHTDRENTPDAGTHSARQDPQTSTSHKHLTTLNGGPCERKTQPNRDQCPLINIFSGLSWTPHGHGDTTRGDGRHTDRKSNASVCAGDSNFGQDRIWYRRKHPIHVNASAIGANPPHSRIRSLCVCALVLFIYGQSVKQNSIRSLCFVCRRFPFRPRLDLAPTKSSRRCSRARPRPRAAETSHYACCSSTPGTLLVRITCMLY